MYHIKAPPHLNPDPRRSNLENDHGAYPSKLTFYSSFYMHPTLQYIYKSLGDTNHKGLTEVMIYAHIIYALFMQIEKYANLI